MVGWHNQLDGHEFEQALEDSEGQGSLACCSPWGVRVRHDLVTEQQAVACSFVSNLLLLLIHSNVTPLAIVKMN